MGSCLTSFSFSFLKAFGFKKIAVASWCLMEFTQSYVVPLWRTWMGAF